MDDTTKLAILTAMSKKIKQVSDDVRHSEDERLIGQFNQSDGKIRTEDVLIDGHKVGTYYVQVIPETAQVTDDTLFQDFCISNGFGSYEKRLDYTRLPQDVTDKLMEQHPECVESRFVLDGDFIECRDGKPYVKGTDHEVPGVEVKPRGCKSPTFRLTEPDMVLHYAIDNGAPAMFLLDGEVDA